MMSSYRVIPGVASVFVVLRVRRFIECVLLILILGFCTFATEPSAGTRPAAKPKRVLLIYQDEMYIPAERALDSGIVSVIGGQPEIQIYSEHLDTYSASDRKFQTAQLEGIRNKYRNRGIDLVIAAGVIPQTILLGVPTVFSAIDSNGLTQTKLPADSTAVWLSADVKGTLASAARLQPHAHQLVVLCGTSAWDRHAELVLRKAPAFGSAGDTAKPSEPELT